MLGRGAYGKVYLASLTNDDGESKHYAVKSIRKDLLLEENKIESTVVEMSILMECDHPFIVRMEYLFQDPLRLYFVMPFVRGAELFKYYEKKGPLCEAEVKFYAA